MQQKVGVARPGKPGRLEIIEGFGVVSLIEFNPAQIIVGKWVIRLHSQRLLKNPFGLDWLAKRPLQETQVPISLSESGIEPDRLTIFRRRLAGHSQTRQSDAAKVARSGVRGMLLFSLREFLQGLAKLPLFKQEQAAAKVVCRL